MGYEPYLNNVKRYSRTFNVRTPNHFISPFFFMAAATTGVAGHVMIYSTTIEDTVTIAASGALKHTIAGFLTQDVKDLDAGAIKGYRNLNNTVENLGGNVGIAQGQFIADTKQYNGSPALGARLCVNDSTGNLSTYTSLMTGDPIAVVESLVAPNQVSLEPQQFSAASGNVFIRIKTYNI